MNYLYLLLSLFLFSCSSNSDIIPCTKLSEIDSYHCYPFNVKTYHVEGLKEDVLLQFPDENFSSDNEEYLLTKWTDFVELDTTDQRVWKSRLGKCDGNTYLQKELLQGDDIYFAGCFRFRLDRDKERYADYYKAIFFNKDSMRLHLLKDLDHYPSFY